MTKWLQVVVVGLFFALLYLYAGSRMYRVLGSLNHLSSPGWTAQAEGTRVLVRQVNRPASASGLTPGDEVVAINGEHLGGSSHQLEAVLASLKPDESYSIVVLRDGRPLQLVLRAEPLPLSVVVLVQAANVVLPAIFLLTGLGVFLLKPFDKQALLLSLMFGMFAEVIPATAVSLISFSWWELALAVPVHLVCLFLWPVFFHFFLVFPEPSRILMRIPRLEYYLYVPHLLTIFPYFGALNVLTAWAPERADAFRNDFFALGAVSPVLFVLYIVGGIGLLLLKYRQAGRPSRRRMRVVVAGSVAGFLPTFLWMALLFAFDIGPASSKWLFFAAIFAFPLFPLSFAYAILRHRVIPVRLILRRGVRYLLVSRGFIVIQGLVVFAVLSFLLTGSRIEAIDRLGERADIVVTLVATVLAVVLLSVVNRRAMPVIDRWFFREAYNAQQLLSDLGQGMRKVTTVPQLLELAVAKIQDALHAEAVTIFMRNSTNGDYACAMSSLLTDNNSARVHTGCGSSLPAGGSIVARLRQATSPVNVDYTAKRAWGRQHQATASDETRMREVEALKRSESVLLVPIATKDELVGIVCLGPRLGDLPYSREDKQMLMAVAWQMAFAIQNARLVEQITEEERLKREFEIAAAVQRRLFPEQPPQLARLELAGVCHPALGVGGDYYDFIQIEEGKVGIAVADVAGKGISAALLMSTVQASLRSQAPSVNGKLTDLVSSMNRLLHFSTDSNGYATFFYAQFDDVTGRLTYVNAGHNPPILVRAASGLRARQAGYAVARVGDAERAPAEWATAAPPDETRLLTTGGPIIGAFLESAYEQETIQMASGDLLVAYTDGVTEAVNATGEEFGELRLRQAISGSAELPAAAIVERAVERVREWCVDAPQHDDLTLVVMKVRA